MRQPLTQQGVLTAVCLLVTALTPAATFGQGALTPPSAPAPMMKTLTQVEPRTDVFTLPGNPTSLHVITAPGSYYLTTNLIGPGGVHGITVLADRVTIDLRGFAIIGAGQFGMNWNAIMVPASQVDLKVLNGTITQWSGEGVSAPTTKNSRLEDLRVSLIGRSALHIGDSSLVNNCVVQSNCPYAAGTPAIWVGDHCKVEMCVAQDNVGVGISTGKGGLVADCVANGNNDGIATGDDSRVTDCVASRNTGNNPGDGINVGYGSSVSDCTANGNNNDGIETISSGSVLGCTARTNGSDGIKVQYGSMVKDCTTGSNHRDGIGVTWRCQAVGNTCDANGRAGIFAYVGNNRIDGNSVTTNAVAGIDCGTSPSTADLVVRNNASGNGMDYLLNPAGGAAGTQNAMIYISPGANFVIMDPWANFSH